VFRVFLARVVSSRVGGGGGRSYRGEEGGGAGQGDGRGLGRRGRGWGVHDGEESGGVRRMWLVQWRLRIREGRRKENLPYIM
jgi:hypothetical protein